MKLEYLNLAVKNLGKRKLRSWLTMLGIFISIATIFILITLSFGLRDAVNEQFRSLGTDKFFIMPKGQLGAPGSGGAVELTINDINIIEKVSGIKSVSYMVAGSAKVMFNEQTRYVYAIGLPLDKTNVFESLFESMNLKITRGKIFEQNDQGVVMLGSLYAEKVFNKPIKAKDKILINDKEFVVKGILSAVGNPSDDKNVYMALDDFKELFNSKDRVDQIIIQINSGENLKEIAAKVEKRLNTFRNVDAETEDYSILTPEELMKSFEMILNIITVFLLGVSGISLVVGGIGIANTMYTSVLERTREIGVMKSIGAKNSDVLWIFLIESGLLGLVGGVIGVLLGFSISKLIEFIAINQFDTSLLKVSFNLWLVLFCLLFSFLVGALSGIFPAYGASKTNTVDALRYE